MPNKHLPLVSIALCTYNGEKFLTKQIESLLQQDYANLEVIIVDDCSADGTLEILHNYKIADTRIRLFENDKNLGYTKNFEKAISLCSGTYIALADQDDIWELDKVSVMIAAMDGNILVYHDSDFIDEDDMPIGEYSMATRSRMYDGESGLPFILFNCISGHAALFSRELVQYMLPFNDTFYHDWWIAYVAINVGRIKFINKILVHYRQHRHNITDLLELRDGRDKTSKPARNIKRISLNLDFLQACSAFNYNRDPFLINKCYNLFSNLALGNMKMQSFLFLFSYFDLFFYIPYKPKNFFSKVNFLRKIFF